MPCLDDHVRPLSAAEQRRAFEPEERAAVLGIRHRIGQIRLTDALLAGESQSTRVLLSLQFPELNLSAGPEDPPSPSRLSPELDDEINRRVFPLDAQARPFLTEEQRIQRGIRLAVEAARDVNLRLPGEGDGTDTPPGPPQDGAAGLSEDERRVLAQVKRDAGVA